MSSTYIGESDFHFTTVDGKQFPHDGTRDSKEAAYARAESHDIHRRAAIEKKLGRSLTEDEYFAGQIKHLEDRDWMTQERDKQFQPVRKEPGRYDKMKADILKRIEERDVAKMDNLERQLWDIEQMEQRDVEQIAEQNSKAAHLKNPRVKAALKELNGLLDSMKWDESRPASEVVRVQNAIIQWECHDGDTAVAETMLRGVLDHEDQRNAALDAAKREQIAQIESTLASASAPAKVEINRQQSLKDQGHDLYEALSDAGLGFKHLDRVFNANQALEAGDSSQLEAMLDAYAVGDNQTLE
ncbi:hypothetical protein [Aeoliella sp.]|uniref:hypothetical protein n=1 Tax=Aeoliella sp. TaxID=2795800 RepID=UPI003CCB8332